MPLLLLSKPVGASAGEKAKQARATTAAASTATTRRDLMRFFPFLGATREYHPPTAADKYPEGRRAHARKDKSATWRRAGKRALEPAPRDRFGPKPALNSPNWSQESGTPPQAHLTSLPRPPPMDC